ncbi:sugar phosphate isomerase/epimerase family protein [Flavitalea flava]
MTTLSSLGILGGSSLFAKNALYGFSKQHAVVIGAITYSFRSLPDGIDNIIKYCHQTGIKAIELKGEAAEEFAGKPTLNKEETEESYKARVRSWRETINFDKFTECRKRLNDSGISVYAFKPDALNDSNTDGEIEYAYKAGKALGANSVTVELPKDPNHSLRLGKLAEKNKIFVGYHAHTQATDTAWDIALSQSPNNSINLDCGHYIAAGGGNTKETLLAFIQQKYQRITSIHLKDRLSKEHGGENMPWGQGDTPIKEIITLIKEKNYPIPMSIELEYTIPAHSDALMEVKKCLEFANQYV